MTCLKIGQIFTSDNSDYMVNSEEWEIVSIDYPTVTFRNRIYMCVEIAGREYSGEYIVVGTVFGATEQVAVVTLTDGFNQGYYAGLMLEGDRASYLDSLDPIIRSHP